MMNGLPCITRRHAITGGLSLLVCSMLEAQQAKGVANGDSSNSHFMMFTANDAEFVTILNRSFPGMINDPLFAKIAPMAALIRQTSGPPVKAYSVTWGALGQVYRFTKISKPGIIRAKGRSSAVFTGQKKVLGIGHVRLVTPFFSLSPKRFRQDPQGWHSHVKKHRKKPKPSIEMLETMDVIAPNLDAVVFKRRHIVGPDTGNLAQRLETIRKAEHSLAHTILRLRGDRTPKKQLVERLLVEHSRKQAPTSQTALIYRGAKRRYAKYLLALFRQDRKAFKKAIRRTYAMHRVAYKRA